MTIEKNEQLNQAVTKLNALEALTAERKQKKTQLENDNKAIMKEISGTYDYKGIQAEDEALIENKKESLLKSQKKQQELCEIAYDLNALLTKIETDLTNDKSNNWPELQKTINNAITHANLSPETTELGAKWLGNLIEQLPEQDVITALFGASKSRKEFLLSEINKKIAAQIPFIEREEKRLTRCKEELTTLEENKNQLSSNYAALAQIEKQSVEIIQLKAQIATLKTDIDRTLANELKALLATYQTDRNARYQIKDKLTAKDKENREQFVTYFNTVLNNYSENGRNEEVLDCIENNRAQYPGIHFQTTLNKIVVTLADAQRDVTLLEKSKDRGEVSAILDNLPREDAEYVKQIKTLRTNILTMGPYANKLPGKESAIVKGLKDELIQDLDYFICQHDKSAPPEKDFNDFSKTFKARLHSQDDVMNKTHTWKFVVANLLAALTVIPLAIKLIHSKVTEKRIAFFFEKTDEQKKNDEIEKGLDDLKTKGPSQ